ncbi:MAG: OmpA/MotB family protein [Candidatus Sumerlaeota bacterium]
MKLKTLAALVLVIAVLSVGVVPVSAHEYDRNDSDYPLRYLAYLVHPIGVALEYTITRPFHKLVHKPGWSYVMGHDVDYKDSTYGEDYTVMAEEGFEDSITPPEALAPDGARQEYEVTMVDGDVRYTVIDGPVLFGEGSADLTEHGMQVVDKIAKRIQQDYAGREIIVEGHTDSQPIVKSDWKSNWELGAARALTITKYMIEKHDFSPERVAAKTYAQYKQAASNETPEGRQSNRRAVIVVKAEKE